MMVLLAVGGLLDGGEDPLDAESVLERRRRRVAGVDGQQEVPDLVGERVFPADGGGGELADQGLGVGGFFHGGEDPLDVVPVQAGASKNAPTFIA